MHAYRGVYTPIPTVTAIAEDAIDVIRRAVYAEATSHDVFTCPIDGCLLAHSLEPCPQCAVTTMVEPCARCGAAVSPWRPCPVCALERATGRRSMIRPVQVPVGV